MKTLLALQLGLSGLLLMIFSSMGAESSEKLKQDIKNHNQKINLLISDNQFDKLQAQAETLRDDIRALAENASQLQERRRARVKASSAEAISLLRALEENAAALDPVAARANYKKLQLPLTALDRAFSAVYTGAGKAADSQDGAEITQLRKDIQTHTRKLNALMQELKPEQVAEEIEELQNDLDAFLAEIKTEVEAIKESAEELERNSRRGNQTEARASYKKLQTAIQSSLALQAPGLEK